MTRKKETLPIGYQNGALKITAVIGKNFCGNEIYNVQCECGRELQLTTSKFMTRRTCGSKLCKAKLTYRRRKEAQVTKRSICKIIIAKEDKVSAHERFVMAEKFLLDTLERWHRLEKMQRALLAD